MSSETIFNVPTNGFHFNPFEHGCPPQCDLVLDAAHRKSLDLSIAPRKEDIVESIIFKASDAVAVTFKDVDLNFARKGRDLIVYLFFGARAFDILASCAFEGVLCLAWQRPSKPQDLLQLQLQQIMLSKLILPTTGS